VEGLPDELRVSARSLNLMPVKGKEREVEIYELVAERSDDLTTLATHMNLPVVRLRLRHNSREMVVGPELTALSFGRDPTNDFSIQDRKASRQHARIERHRHTFVLVDMSSHGTYVSFHVQEELVVRREQTVLHGRGALGFG